MTKLYVISKGRVMALPKGTGFLTAKAMSDNNKTYVDVRVASKDAVKLSAGAS